MNWLVIFTSKPGAPGEYFLGWGLKPSTYQDFGVLGANLLGPVAKRLKLFGMTNI